MQITVIPSNFIRASVLDIVKRVKKAPIVGTNDFLGYQMTIYSLEGSYHVILKDGKRLVGHMELVGRAIDIGIESLVSVRQTHCYLEKAYRGLGIAYALYEWAAKRWTLIPSEKHTAGANHLWRKLSANHPTILLRRIGGKRSHRYLILAELTSRQFKQTQCYQLILGEFVDWK